MAIPEAFQSSKFPTEFDSNQNLFLVHDSLKVTLLEDYNPEEDTSITVDGDISSFPSTGIITLTEQCSEVTKRAISFFYTSKTNTTFEGLVALSGFDNTIVRSKRVTYVTQNVMASHHNCLKDALIAIQEFVGVKGTTDASPFGSTMEGRINFLRQLVLSPRAWFTADKRIGLVPLEVTFRNESFRLGDGEVTVTWDFGDANSAIPLSSLSTISVSSVVPISTTDVRVEDIDSGTVSKFFTEPGNYTVTLTVENEFGSDTVVFEDFINARVEAPIEAIIEFSHTSDQTATPGDPTIGPFTTTPKIRSRTNKFIDMFVPDGIHPTTLRTYGGEVVIGSTPIDPIDTYTWSLSDDLFHPNSAAARASYSIGGLYDLILRCDTRFGSYRITTYEQALDIVEDRNLWLFTIPSGADAYPNEFGLISETFKTGTTPYTIQRDYGFLTGTNNETQAVKEFKRNAFFTINGTVTSGNHGTALLAYAGGGGASSLLSDQLVRLVDFEGFGGTIVDNSLELYRPWNWLFFAFDSKAYFLFGADPDADSDINAAYADKDTLTLGGTLSYVRTTLVNPDNFINGASELLEHVTSGFDGDGEPENGRFAVYRSAKKDSTGYFLRNDGVGAFFKLRSFYKTEGVTSNPVINIRKLTDMTGQVKTEGQLVGLSSGMFFFNNSGNIVAYNTTDGTWEIGNSTAPFKSFQDDTVDDFDNRANALLATSDGERTAYLSYDYSTNAFIKYNSVDLTFASIGQRPDGEQWLMGIY